MPSRSLSGRRPRTMSETTSRTSRGTRGAGHRSSEYVCANAGHDPDRTYVELDGKMLRPTRLGQQVNDFLVVHFSEVVDLAFTAELEARLGEIARGLRPWVPTVTAYYQPLAAHLRNVGTVAPPLGSGGEPSDEVCSQGHAMVVKEGRSAAVSWRAPGTPTIEETRSLATQSVGVGCPACGPISWKNTPGSDAMFFGCSAWPTCHWTSSYPSASRGLSSVWRCAGRPRRPRAPLPQASRSTTASGARAWPTHGHNTRLSPATPFEQCRCAHLPGGSQAGVPNRSHLEAVGIPICQPGKYL